MAKKSEQSLKEMRRENERLLEENLCLRMQLKLYRENCGLRAAMDSERFATSQTYGVSIKKLDDVIKSQYCEDSTNPAHGNNITTTAIGEPYNKETAESRKKIPPVRGNPSQKEQLYSVKNTGNWSQKNSASIHKIGVQRGHPVEQALDSTGVYETESLRDSTSSCSDQQVPRYGSSNSHVWTQTQNRPGQSTYDNHTAKTPNYSRVGPPVATSTPIKDKVQSVRGVSVAAKPGRNQGTSQSEAIVKFLNNARPNKRLLGEIAFQLDRRILNYVFSTGEDEGKQRFYGYTLQNIPGMIRHDSVDPNTGQYDPQKAARIQHRYEFVLRSLRPLGYRIETHAEVAADFVNRYGLLPVPVYQATADLFSVKNAGIIEDYLRNNGPKHEVHNLLVFLDSLALLATEDGKNLFLW